MGTSKVTIWVIRAINFFLLSPLDPPGSFKELFRHDMFVLGLVGLH